MSLYIDQGRFLRCSTVYGTTVYGTIHFANINKCFEKIWPKHWFLVLQKVQNKLFFYRAVNFTP